MADKLAPERTPLELRRLEPSAIGAVPMPVLVMAGDTAMGDVLEIQAKIVSDNVTAIKFADTGHWLMEERPMETKAALKKFFSLPAQANQ